MGLQFSQMYEVLQHIIAMLIGGTVDTVVYAGILPDLTTVILTNPFTALTVGFGIIGLVFALFGKIVSMARTVA